jgi:hypothetical protein
MQQFMLFVEEESNSKIAYLFFGIFSGGDEIDSFEMPEVDTPAENVDVKELPSTSAVAPLAFAEINVAITPCRHISSSGTH